MRSIREKSIQLGHFQILPDSCRVRCHDKFIRLEKKSMDVLLFLAARPGEIIAREELLDAIWPNITAGDQALNRAISNIRKSLNDCVDAPRIIETIPHKGYRIIAECRPATAGVNFENADLLPFRYKIYPIGIFAFASICVVFLAVTVFATDWLRVKQRTDRASVRIIATNAGMVYVAPTIMPSDRQDLSEVARHIKSTVIESLNFLELVVLASDQNWSPLPVPDWEREELVSNADVGFLISAEIIPIESTALVRIILIDARSGKLLWHHTFDYEPDGFDTNFQTQLQTTLSTEAAGLLR